MSEEGNFDVKRVLDRSSSKTTISELAKKGVQHVKVLDEGTLRRLIKEAVENIALSKANLLTEQERVKIYEESKKELDRLVKEYSASKTKNEKFKQDYDGLVKEIENLNRQLELTKKTYEEQIRQLQLTAAQYQHQPLPQMQPQQQYYPQPVMQVVQQPTKQDDLLQRLDELSKKDDAIANKLSAIFMKAIEGITKKVEQGHLVIPHQLAIPEAQIEYKPNTEVLENMLKEALESNLGSVQQEKKTASKLQDTITKLKMMRGTIDSKG